MIPNFPKPFPDELLYSLIARHQWLAQSRSLKSMAESIFATPHALAVVDLPARLGALCEAVGDGAGLNVATTIRNHTLLPLYAPFLPPQRLAMIEEDLRGNGGGAVHFRTGIMASRVRPAFRLRYCPCCAARERAESGEAYWHRLHQIGCVFICPEHEVLLEESSVPIQLRRTRHIFIAAEDAIPQNTESGVNPGSPDQPTFVRIAHGAKWLLDNYLAGTDLAGLRAGYLHHLMKLGFLTGSGRILWRPLLREFQARFPTELLQKLNCPLPQGNSDHWLARILRRPRVVQAPVRHLVLMEFIGLSPEAFFCTEVSGSIFGLGPWVCNNPVCSRSGEATMTQLQYAHSQEHRRPLGLFTCPICGQVRCRVLVGDKELTWIRDYGPVWKQELEKLWRDESVSLRYIARRLAVDPLTAKRHAWKAGLGFPRQAKRLTSANGALAGQQRPCKPDHELDQRRSEWIALRKQLPAATTGALRRHAAACYTFLYRHDRAWLQNHCPSRSCRGKRRARVDWRTRDALLSRKVELAREGLLAEPGRPKRISISALGRQMGALARIQKHGDKLPETMDRLSRAVESHLQFADRRLAWAAAQAGRDQSKVKPWMVIRAAGLRPELTRAATIRRGSHSCLSGTTLPQGT